MPVEICDFLVFIKVPNLNVSLGSMCTSSCEVWVYTDEVVTSTQMNIVKEVPGSVNVLDPSRGHTANKDQLYMVKHHECRNGDKLASENFAYLWEDEQVPKSQSLCNQILCRAGQSN